MCYTTGFLQLIHCSDIQNNNGRVEHIFCFVLRDFISRKKLNIKNFKIENKDNKISHGRGNSLSNKVRGWVNLDSPDPLKPLPTGWENAYEGTLEDSFDPSATFLDFVLFVICLFVVLQLPYFGSLILL